METAAAGSGPVLLHALTSESTERTIGETVRAIQMTRLASGDAVQRLRGERMH